MSCGESVADAAGAGALRLMTFGGPSGIFSSRLKSIKSFPGFADSGVGVLTCGGVGDFPTGDGGLACEQKCCQ